MLRELLDVVCEALVGVAQAAVEVGHRVERVAAHVLLHRLAREALAEQARDLYLHVLDHAVGHAGGHAEQHPLADALPEFVLPRG